MLDINKLELYQTLPNGTSVYRCPACAEDGHDNTGNHLIIYPDNAYACVVYPGDMGEEHRKKIYRLAGIKRSIEDGFAIYPKRPVERTILKKNVLGCLGRPKTYSLKNKNTDAMNNNKNKKTTVPTVPINLDDYLK